MPPIRQPNHLTRALLGGLAVLLAALVTAPGALANQPYQNPLAGDGYHVHRTDMGVDFCLHAGEPIRAVGAGVVVGIKRDWYQGQPYLWYKLTGGGDAGRYVYVAEQIRRLAHIGQVLHAGEVIARYAKQGTCIEMGWSVADGTTMAHATTGYSEGQVTRAGVQFARFLISAGVHGPFEVGGTTLYKTTNAKPPASKR